MMQNIGQEDRNPAAAENPASLSLPQDPPRADSWVLDLERVFVWAREVATVWDGYVILASLLMLIIPLCFRLLYSNPTMY